MQMFVAFFQNLYDGKVHGYDTNRIVEQEIWALGARETAEEYFYLVLTRLMIC